MLVLSDFLLKCCRPAAFRRLLTTLRRYYLQTNLQHITRVLELNALGTISDDLASCKLRGGAEPHVHLGLWPEYAVMNHECSPNAVHLVVGDRLLVRATGTIFPGQEVCVNYLGR